MYIYNIYLFINFIDTIGTWVIAYAIYVQIITVSGSREDR